MFRVISMRIIILLNRYRYLESFVYEKERLEKINAFETLAVEALPRKNGKGICSHYGQLAVGYDGASQPRLFAFVRPWRFPMYLRYA
jgi:hypothetical protein